jgi:hypothetical protein
MLFRVALFVICCSAVPAAAQQSDFVGKYSAGKAGYRWTAVIAPGAGAGFKIKLEVTSQRPPCSGALETTGALKGEEIVTAPPEKGDDCQITISKAGRGIAIKENKCMMWHGASCEFSSQLNRQ